VATLSSTSTLAEVQAAYDDNASYAEDASAGKAAAFITACRILLRRMPKRAVDGKSGQEIENEMLLLRKEMDAAQQWLARQSSTGGTGQTRHFGSAYDFRD